jgi:hypothetical protein
VIGAGIAGAAHAQTNVPAGVHTVSEHWTTAGNPYRLQGQVYFSNASTLTIDAGVLVVSQGPGYLGSGAVDPAHPSVGGSLAICRDSKIIINGTATNPVIMTTTNDVHTWAGTVDNGTEYDTAQVPGNPHTGTWRAHMNEWGNLTVMGRGYISANNHGGVTTNVPTPNANNTATMEGLTNGPATDLYGGGNDDDDSGTIAYVSLRYGGKVVALNNELNGLSMGGIGRSTTVHHVDIMNNVDDGIETWGGTVNYRYLNIWNIGDDSMDWDEGWRGKAQFGLSVVGTSDATKGIGGGTGDHNFEMDGAEDSDWQPCSTNAVYNFTCIGQPGSPRGMTAWRDNNRTQFHNCIFMDCGSEVVKLDNVDGDGAHGYGFGGTLTWLQTWATPWNMVPATPNDPPPGLPNYHNDVQCSGFLASITDSIFFRNQNPNAYTEANNVGVFAAGNNNFQITGITTDDMPILQLVRGAPVSTPGYLVFPVATLDPRPKNEALRRVETACNPFFEQDPKNFRGGFGPNDQVWIHGWTAAEAFGFVPVNSEVPMTSFCWPGVANVINCPCNSNGTTGHGCANSANSAGAILSAVGTTSLSGDTLVFTSSGEKPTATTIFLQGTANVFLGTPFGQGVRCVGGSLKRLYTHNASGGVVSAPIGADLSVHQRSANLGDTILPGQHRKYMAYYRDPVVPVGCDPSATFNATQSGEVVWDN